MQELLVYMTTENSSQAETIGRALVENRLAACVNILGGMRSLYWWDDKVQSDNETVLLAKTTDNNLDALTSLVKELHTYDVPCIVALPITGGNPDFLSWIQKETAGRG